MAFSRHPFELTQTPDMFTHNNIDYVSANEAARRLNLTLGGLDHHVRKGRLKPYHIPNPYFGPSWGKGSRFFRADEIDTADLPRKVTP